METIMQQTSLEQSHIRTVCLVVPTYNEAQNIGKLLQTIFNQEYIDAPYPESPLKILVVDDNSPDGTAQIVRAHQKNNPNIFLLLRNQKQGLGAAYIAGMKHAMQTIKPDVIFEMDADFSHNPEDIYRMLAAIRDGADFVIGSRYVQGGKLPEHWGIHRKLVSNCANMATRILLGTTHIKDCSGGFRAMRTDILEKIDMDSLHVQGYAFQAVLLEAVIHKNGTVREIPIEFSEREAGQSKLRLKDIIEGFTALSRVRAKRLIEQSPLHKNQQPVST